MSPATQIPVSLLALTVTCCAQGDGATLAKHAPVAGPHVAEAARATAAAETVRATYFYAPSGGDLGPHSEFLPLSYQSATAAFLEGGSKGDLVTFLSPRLAAKHTAFSRLMTGVGERMYYVELDVPKSALKPVGGLKGAIPIIRNEQSVVQGRVRLPGSNPSFGVLEPNLLAVGCEPILLLLIGGSVYLASGTYDAGEQIAALHPAPWRGLVWSASGSKRTGEGSGSSPAASGSGGNIPALIEALHPQQEPNTRELLEELRLKYKRLRIEVASLDITRLPLFYGIQALATIPAAALVCRICTLRRKPKPPRTIAMALCCLPLLVACIATFIQADIWWLQQHEITPQALIAVVGLLAGAYILPVLGVVAYFLKWRKQYDTVA
jgi:hypothetical protein